jgi:hypothetical protein
VEVHVATAAPGPLWYRTGQIGRVNLWDGSHPFRNPENGFNPSVAISGSTAVVMYNAGAAAGPLHYRIGQVTGSTIQWGDPQPHDPGLKVSIAMSGSLVVEVHSATTAAKLSSRVGRVTGSTIKWGPPQEYDSGFHQAVALSGTTVVEIHNSTGAAVGKLSYRVGTIDEGQLRIVWGGSTAFPELATSSLFDVSVAVSGSAVEAVIVVYNGPVVGDRRPLLYLVGEIIPQGATQTISWGNGNWIDSGSSPSVAAVVRGKDADGKEVIHAIEVHNETNAAGPLWYREGRVDTGLRTSVLKAKPSDVKSSREARNWQGPLCLVGPSLKPADPQFAPGEAIVGFWDQFAPSDSGPLPQVDVCPEREESIFRGTVRFDLSMFDSIVDAHLGFNIPKTDREGGTGKGPPCAATKLGMSTGLKSLEREPHLWDFDHEVDLPSDCRPPTIESEGQPRFSIPVTSQVQAWVNKSHPNFGFILAGPRMVFNNDLPTDNDHNITTYGGNFQLKLLFDPKRNPRFKE